MKSYIYIIIIVMTLGINCATSCADGIEEIEINSVLLTKIEYGKAESGLGFEVTVPTNVGPDVLEITSNLIYLHDVVKRRIAIYTTNGKYRGEIAFNDAAISHKTVATSDHNIYLATGYGISKWDHNNQKWIPYKKLEKTPRSLIKDIHDNLFFSFSHKLMNLEMEKVGYSSDIRSHGYPHPDYGIGGYDCRVIYMIPRNKSVGWSGYMIKNMRCSQYDEIDNPVQIIHKPHIGILYECIASNDGLLIYKYDISGILEKVNEEAVKYKKEREVHKKERK